MSYTNQTGQTSATNTNTITAFFDSRSDADNAVERLIDAGLPRSSIQLIEGATAEAVSGSRTEESGFWAALENFFFPDDDRSTYAEGLRRGGYLVTVTGYPLDMHDTALDILDDEGSIDLDERTRAWESEGWSRSGSITSSRSTQFENNATGYQAEQLNSEHDDVIPVVEEELRVGKRDINNGRVRVRSYVTEMPVSENISLRDENVEITRRPVDRPVSATDSAFIDRTIEAEEHHEEAVVSKDARVVEEIGLRITAEQREETITDTIRKTDVEIEDDRESGMVRKDGTSGIQRD
ncbi:DUF2382 domain-containing protein (plasmid) [Agrobacterium sp. MA01]|uniref:YsnF/AvaK domain-containing protein n=1 Tax=Agrobacterium sp. MA01 TaxID=2664893 RepID=UPI00129B5F57|nr:YsnF/AvaK domain-containing protein [Agrobacterium sp. MA01]QGG93243.1 DUF2382 domain-containing protein [Agrobacterium sp. MA01]